MTAPKAKRTGTRVVKIRVKRRACKIVGAGMRGAALRKLRERQVEARHLIEDTWTDADEAEVQRQIAADPDDEEITDERAGQRMTFAQALPDIAESIKRSRGRPAMTNPKRPISLRLSPEVIEAFKATGKGWQSRIDDALRKAAGL